MNPNLILLIAQILVLILSYVFKNYIYPQVSKESIDAIATKIQIIVEYADRFVHWANQFMKNSTGNERMAEVVSQLKSIADKYSVDVSEDEITAIAQRAYDAMKETLDKNK